MSDLQVYGHIVSQPTRSVLTFLKLSNISYQFNSLDFTKGENLTPEFARINPYQTMPAILHNGHNVWESPAIVSYIAAVYNTDNQWYPKDPRVRSRIDAYFHWHHLGVREPCMNYLRGKVLGPKLMGLPELTDEQEAPLRARFIELLDDIKWHIASTGYVARTTTPSIADVFAFNEVTALRRLYNLDEHAEVKAWFEQIAAITEVQELSAQAQEILLKILG